MIKQTITYKDFNDVERTEDFWFHLDKADLLEFHAMRKGGMKEYMKDIVEADDNEKILEVFKMFILRSVGKRSEDGRLFDRSDAIRDEFRQTNAYSEFLFQLAGDAELGAKFVNGIMPAGLEEELKNYVPGGGQVELPADTSTNDAETADKIKQYLNELTPQEIDALPYNQFRDFQGRTQPGRMNPEQVQAAYRRQLSGR